MIPRTLSAAVVALGLTSVAPAVADDTCPNRLEPKKRAEGAPPFQLSRAVGSPPWLDFSFIHVARYEALSEEFKPGFEGSEMALALRTHLAVEVRPCPVFFGVEFVDARRYLTSDDALVSTIFVNTLEPLQLYGGFRYRGGMLEDGDAIEVRGGRLTFDVGSRRLVARNRFRNAINAFTGVHGAYTSATDDHVVAFATLPLRRLPDEATRLRRNAAELDQESFHQVFWGLFVGSRPLFTEALGGVGLIGEGYVYGLHERDGDDLATRNRRLITPGVRVFRPRGRGVIDAEVEAMVQAGTSRASASPMDTEDLDHLAFSSSASVAYTFDVAWEPRIMLQHDYASGDASPTDGRNGDFDFLFGVRRFDFSPPGLWKVLVRRNLHSPRLRLSAHPLPALRTLLAYRPVWLASSRGAWRDAGLRDPSGNSGDFLMHQLEARVKYEAVPRLLKLEAGLAHAELSDFAYVAPGGRRDLGQTDVDRATWGYLQVTLTL